MAFIAPLRAADEDDDDDDDDVDEGDEAYDAFPTDEDGVGGVELTATTSSTTPATEAGAGAASVPAADASVVHLQSPLHSAGVASSASPPPPPPPPPPADGTADGGAAASAGVGGGGRAPALLSPSSSLSSMPSPTAATPLVTMSARRGTLAAFAGSSSHLSPSGETAAEKRRKLTMAIKGSSGGHASGGGGGGAGAGGATGALSVDIAKALAEEKSPGVVGPDGVRRPHPLCGTPTGRFCCSRWAGVSALAPYGPGITSLFKAWKALAWALAVSTLLHMPVMVMNANQPPERTGGAAAALENSVTRGLFLLTMGALGSPPAAGANGTAALLLPALNVDVPRPYVAQLYSILTAVSGIMMLVAYAWIKYWTLAESDKVSGAAFTIEAYSVQVRWLPRCATAESVKAHMQAVTGVNVVDVVIVDNDPTLLAMCVKRGKLLTKLDEANGKIAKLEAAGKGASPLIAKLKAKVAKREAAIRALTAGPLAAAAAQPCSSGAFVTFERPSGRDKALEMFPRSVLQSMFSAPRERWYTAPDGTSHRLRCSAAPSPSVILWENFCISPGVVFFWRVVSVLAQLVVLGLSTSFLWWASAKAAEARAEKPDNTGCPDTPVSEAAAASNSTLVPCYCANIDAVEFLTTTLCLRYFETAARGIALQHVASIAVAVFNLIIAYISKKLAGLECHRSLDGLHLAFAQRLLLSSFVNTALLTLLVNAKVGGLTFFGGSGFDDFNVSWFQQVGVSMSVTMISQIFVPHSPSFLRWFIAWLCRRRGTAGVHTQRALNQRFIGPEYHLSMRYAHVLNQIAVCLMYSAGIPFLVPLSLFCMVLSYWLDKWLFLRAYQTPPRYDVTFGLTMLELIPLFVALQQAFGIWMYTAPTIFPPSSVSLDGLGDDSVPIYRRLRQSTVVPMTISLFVIAALTVVRALGTTAHGGLRRICVCWRTRGPTPAAQQQDAQDSPSPSSRPAPKGGCCACCSRGGSILQGPEVEGMFWPSFYSAKISAKFSGLDSYSILANSSFSTRFGLSRGLSKQCKTLRDIARHDPTVDRASEMMGSARNLLKRDNMRALKSSNAISSIDFSKRTMRTLTLVVDSPSAAPDTPGSVVTVTSPLSTASGRSFGRAPLLAAVDAGTPSGSP